MVCMDGLVWVGRVVNSVVVFRVVVSSLVEWGSVDWIIRGSRISWVVCVNWGNCVGNYVCGGYGGW